jgi:molecular chaperone DnaK (HSP70)
MLDCTPHAIGAELANGHFVEIIPRNTPLPARGSATFVLADKYQAGVTIRAVEHVGQKDDDDDDDDKYEPMAEEDFSFLLRRLLPQDYQNMSERSIQVGMKLDTQGQFMVSIFDEKDPEQVRKKERFEKASTEAVVGELGYITDLVWAESGTTMEQFLLMGILAGLLVLYVAVKMAFSEPGEGGEPII